MWVLYSPNGIQSTKKITKNMQYIHNTYTKDNGTVNFDRNR